MTKEGIDCKIPVSKLSPGLWNCIFLSLALYNMRAYICLYGTQERIAGQSS